MRATWQTKIVFWAAIIVSGVCLVLLAALDVVAIHSLFTRGLRPAELEPIEILNLSAFALLPPILLFLIIRAIRLRADGRTAWIIARAFYPLAVVALLMCFVFARNYFDIRSEIWRDARWTEGSIVHVCSTFSSTIDYDLRTIGSTRLRLMEFRNPGKLSTWFVIWPGKAPIQTESFDVQTGSIGGSEGIKWREPDGTHRVAHLSFSDLMGEYGPSTIWVDIAQSDVAGKILNSDPMPKLTCGPDPASYRR
jgi:hypothetical protein